MSNFFVVLIIISVKSAPSVLQCHYFGGNAERFAQVSVYLEAKELKITNFLFFSLSGSPLRQISSRC